MPSRARRLAIAALVALATLGAGTASSAAAPDAKRPEASGSPGGAGGRPDGGRPGAGGGGGSAQADPFADPGAEENPAAVGTVNPLAIRNPFCDAGGLERAQRRNCRVTGTPEGRYPTSNHGFDIHIDTGLDNVSGNFAAMIAQIAGAIWSFCLFVLQIVLTVLGWAFALSPFTDNEALREIDSGLGRFYRAFTDPWLVVAMVSIGAWALYRGIVRREVAATVAGTAMSVALMLVGLWVVHEPKATIGTVTEHTNAAAVSVLAAPQSGSVSNRVGDYGEATDEVWRSMTLPGFAVLNFSNVEWALSEPDEELLETADDKACLDAAYLAQIPPRRWEKLLDPFADRDCGDLAAFVPAPRTNAEIWLRNSPGSPARESLWEEHADDAPYSSYSQIQGEGGAATRFPLVCLIALGLLGGILLLAWIAMRLFMQTAVAFVLVLIAPLALFLPAFGERGRAGFGAWGTTLLGAVVSKLVYAALLSVVLLATSVIGSLTGASGGLGATMGFLAMAALWWAVFLNRNTLLAFLSISEEPREGGSRLGAMLGLYSMARVGQRLAGARLGAGGGAGEGRLGGAKDRLLGERGDREEATARVAGGDLDARGERRLDAKLAADEELIGAQGSRREQLAEAGRGRTEALKEARRHEHAAKGAPSPGERARHQRARETALERASALRERQGELRGAIRKAAPGEAQASSFVAGARERERMSGRRWSGEELGQAREAIRSEADRPPEDPAHAWRVGMSRERYAALEGAERERAHGEVAGQLRADKAAFGAIPDRPDGLVGRRASRRYRRQVVARPGGEQRLHAERRHAARQRRRRPSRRGVSR